MTVPSARRPRTSALRIGGCHPVAGCRAPAASANLSLAELAQQQAAGPRSAAMPAS